MSPRPPTGVRERLVDAAQRAFHERGFHGTGLDEVLRRAGAAKGGLYHHFPDKRALGEAVVRERLAAMVEARWGDTAWHADPVRFLTDWLASMDDDDIALGCPINTLAQEVAYQEPRLRRVLADVFERWAELLAEGFRAGIDNGTVRADADPEEAATFMLVTFEGVVSLAKTHRLGKDFVRFATGPAVRYLEGLRA